MSSDRGEVPGRERVDLPYDPAAAELARRHVRGALEDWRLAGLADSALLLVSELVGNAVRHGLPPLWLDLDRVAGGIRMGVHDAAPEPPLLDPVVAELDAEGGRGMFLVAALAASHGYDSVPGDGKSVWAVVRS